MNRSILPHDPEIELQVLGAIAMTEVNGLAPVVFASINRKYFFSEPHADMFDHLQHVFNKHGSCGIMMMRSYFVGLYGSAENNQFIINWNVYTAAVGKVAYVSTEMMDYLLDRLREYAIVQRVGRLGYYAAQQAEGFQFIDPEDVGALVSRIQDMATRLDETKVGSSTKEEGAKRAQKELDDIENNIALGIRTGVDVFDNATGGMRRGYYLGLAARQGIGKSVMMEQALDSLMVHYEPACVFSQDMSVPMLMRRMACRRAKVSIWKLESGLCPKGEIDRVREEIEIIRTSPLHFECLSPFTPESLDATMRFQLLKHGCRHFWADHMGHLRGYPREEPRLVIQRGSRNIRNFVNRNDCFFGGLAHLNRMAAGIRPQAHHVKECDDVLGDADQLMLIWKDQKKWEAHDGQAIAPVTFTMAKNRNGPEGDWDCGFKKATMEFINS